MHYISHNVLVQVCRNEKQLQQGDLHNDSAHAGAIMDTSKSDMPLNNLV